MGQEAIAYSDSVVGLDGRTAEAPVKVSPTNPLPVEVTGGGDATAANQITIIARLDSILSKLTEVDDNTDTVETKLQTLIDDTTAAAVFSPPRLVTLTPSIEATALDAGDVIFATEVLATVTRANDVNAWLMSVSAIDKADQKAEIKLVFFSANRALGTEDAAPSISDSDAVDILGIVTIPSGAYSSSNLNGWQDLGGVSTATLVGLNLPIKPSTGTDDIYVAAYTGGTPTYGAADALAFTFGFAD